MHISDSAIVSKQANCMPGCWIGPGVEIRPGAVISPGAVIGLAQGDDYRGPTVIGASARIGVGAQIEPGVTIGDEVCVDASAVIHRGVRVGKGSRIGQGCTVCMQVIVGEYTQILANVYISEYAKIGSHCQLSPGVILIADQYPPTALTLAGPTIADCAIIGTKSIIWPGITIGYHALVGSLAEVKEDVEEFVLAQGRPAKAICDVRMIRMKLDGKWIYPYPWMRLNMIGEDLSLPVEGAHERNLQIMRNHRSR